MEKSLTIQFSLSSNSIPVLSFFFRIEQDIPSSDPPTVDQVARAIDGLTGQDYCNGTASTSAYDPGETTGPDTTVQLQDFLSEKLSDQLTSQNFADQLGLGEQCLTARNEDITVKIYLFWQNRDIANNYRLESSSGAIFSAATIVTQNLTKEFTVSESSFKETEYFFDINPLFILKNQIEFEWIGNVVDEDKNIIAGPESLTLVDNSILDFGKAISGTFRVTFPTKYHAVDVTIKADNGRYDTVVYGIWQGGHVVLPLVTPDGEIDNDCPLSSLFGGEVSGSVSVTGTVAGEEPEGESVPDVFCFWLTSHELRQPCGNNALIDSWKTRDPVQCPDDIVPTLNTGYGEISDIASREYYEVGKRTVESYISKSDPRFEHSCSACTEEGFEGACGRPAEPGEPIPPCLEIKTAYAGGVEIEKGREYWDAKYPGGVVYQPLAPKSGTCGDKRVKFEAEDDCDSLGLLKYEDDNVEVIIDGSDVTVYFVYGKLPIVVELSGTGFYLDAAGTQTKVQVDRRYVRIHAINSCGACVINATDACKTNATGVIRSSEGVWVEIDRWGFFDGTDDQFAECVIGQNKYYEDFCGRSDGCPGTCPGDESMYCQHPPHPQGEICTANGRITYEWQCG